MVAAAGIHIKQTLPDAVASLIARTHQWPGLTIVAGDNKIVVTMLQKLSIYIPKDWRGWPVEIVNVTP